MPFWNQRTYLLFLIGINFIHGWEDLESITASCPTMFRQSAGNVECHLDVDTGVNSVILHSDGLPDHWYDLNTFNPLPQNWEISFPVDPSNYQNSAEYKASFKGGAQDIDVGDIVGFAINGVPFIKAPHPSSENDEVYSNFDGCLGNIDLTSGAYYYVLASPCLFDLKNDFSAAFEDGHYLDSFATLGFPSPIVGYALDGYPIHGPYDENGAPHTGLDSCNGKYDVTTSKYAYYATEQWPYLVNCFGPGEGANSFLHSVDEVNVEAMLNNEQNVITSKLACMDGYYRKELNNQYDAGRGVGQSVGASAVCIPCPPGRFGSVVAGGKGNLNENCGRSCPRGFFCPAGSSYPLKCPPGRWGSSEGLGDAGCDGACEAGYYCPERSEKPNALPCGNASYYCPEESPRPIVVSEGYYSTTNNEGYNYHAVNHYETEIDQLQRQRKLEMISPNTPRELSAASMRRTSQMICEPGNYCVDGVRYACPAGTFGESSGLTANGCTDCPLGHYCPERSPLPIRCPAGTYGGVTNLKTSACSGECSPGYYCPPRSTSPTQVECPAGRFGAQAALTSPSCSLNCDDATSGQCLPTFCQQGYYCPPASTSAQQNQCGNSSVFCPEGSALPTPVSIGHYTVGSSSLPGEYQSTIDQKIRYSQKICEPGSYCIDGVRYPCPAGTFGESSGLTTAECSGPCEFGYYCPEQSTSARQRHCGGTNAYCPGGVGLPVEVGAGNYSIGITALRLLGNDTYGSQDYFNAVDEEDGRGEWYTEVYDPQNTVRDRSGHKRFTGRHGVGVRGVDITDLGSSINRVAQASCPPGAYCENGVARLCPAGTYGFSFGLQTPECSGLCGAGYYCPQGSIRRHEFICEAGRWSQEGAGDEKCSGVCEAGYYCPEGSQSPRQNECGGETFYCPVGSGVPLNVSKDYYATGNTITTRTAQVSCKESPPMGINITKLCPSTTMPLSGPTKWYDHVVDEYEYKRDVNDLSVDQ